MRRVLGSGAAVAVLAVALGGCGGTGTQQAAAQAKPEGELITAVGCATTGQAPGCVTIKAKGKVYDISNASPAVDLSRGVTVSLKGVADGTSTACGAKLSDIRYDYLSFQCAKPAPAPTATVESTPPA